MELFLLYVWMKLPALSWAMGLASLILMVIWFAYWVWGCDEDSMTANTLARMAARRAGAGYKKAMLYPYYAICLAAVNLVMPGQTQTAVLVAGHYALTMAASPEASKVMAVLRKKANEYLDEELATPKK